MNDKKIEWIPVYKIIDGKKVEVGAVSKEWNDFATETFDEAFSNMAKSLEKELWGDGDMPKTEEICPIKDK